MAKHMTGEEATRLGYRRTSNKYLMVSRIDRPDWVEVMAEDMMRASADFIIRSGPNKGKISPGWCDHYRRGYSKDKFEFPNTPEGRAEFKKVPGSDFDPCGYVPKLEVADG